jgi:diguanylate cyclase (GGDEF)-like protein
MLCVFLLSGLLFRSALVAGLAMLAAHLAASVFFSVPATIRIESGIFLGAIAAVGSGVYWNMDHASRKSFLERELIAELALRDALTGLRNRRAFDEYFVRLWAQAVGDRRRLAIVMFDVDHFKRFNDLNGHQLGDDVLQRVARCARGLSDRPMDFASRYGGDEFVLLLYDLAQEHVRDLAERLRHVVADLRIECPGAAGGPAVTVTITIGVVVIAPTPGRNPGCALRFADEALYRAKQAGRNCVRMIREEEYNMLDACTLDGSELGRTG